MKPIDLFERWFGDAIKILQKLPAGDGAVAALMIAIPLYERYIIGKLKLDGKPTDDVSVQAEVGSDLNLTDGQRRVFWEMFRNGFMHQAMAKDGKTKWRISHVYSAKPVFITKNGVQYVCLDPWKFTDRVLNHFRNDTQLITASESFPLADIFVMPPDISNTVVAEG